MMQAPLGPPHELLAVLTIVLFFVECQGGNASRNLTVAQVGAESLYGDNVALSWSAGSITACVSVAAFCSCLPVCMCLGAAVAACQSPLGVKCRFAPLGGYDKWRRDEVDLRAYLVGELCLAILLPWFALGLAALLVSAGPFQDRDIPWYVPVLACLLAVIRAGRVEAALIRLAHEPETTVLSLLKEDCRKRPAWAFVSSKLEIVDVMTDAISVAAVFLLEQEQLFRDRLLAAWGTGSLGHLFAPLLSLTGLSGLMLTSLGISTAVHALAAYLHLIGPRGANMAAELAGFGALACRNKHDFSSVDIWWVDLVRVVYEGSFQLYLQSTAVLAAGAGFAAHPTLVISIVLTGAMLVKRAAEMWRLVMLAVRRALSESSVPCMDIVLAAMFSLPIWFVLFTLGAVCLRLALPEMRCPESLLFSISSWSCVNVPSAHNVTRFPSIPALTRWVPVALGEVAVLLPMLLVVCCSGLAWYCNTTEPSDVEEDAEEPADQVINSAEVRGPPPGQGEAEPLNR